MPNTHGRRPSPPPRHTGNRRPPTPPSHSNSGKGPCALWIPAIPVVALWLLVKAAWQWAIR